MHLVYLYKKIIWVNTPWIRDCQQVDLKSDNLGENFIKNYIDESSEFDHILYVARDGHAIDYFFYENGLKWNWCYVGYIKNSF